MNAANDDAFEAGRQAGFDGRPLESNPHSGGDKSRGGQSVDMGNGPPERGGGATNKGEVEPLRFSTDDFPERDRVAMWRELFGRLLVRLDIEPLPQAGFRARYILHALPGLRISSCIGGGAREWRTRELLSDGNDDLVMVISLKGGIVASQRGREFVLGEQEAILASSGEVGGIIRPKPDQFLVCLRLPRAAIGPLVPNADAAVMRRIAPDCAALRLLIRYAGVLRDTGMRLQPELQRSVVDHIYDLVAATIGGTRDAIEVAKGRGIPAARLSAIKGDILENLLNRNLSIADVCARHGITPRYLSMLFAREETTFSDFVVGRRLALARRCLRDPARAGRTISAIAYECGFGDLSYFNRVFRRQFGSTPSDLRAEAMAPND